MNELIPADLIDTDVAIFDDVVASATTYLKRLQLFGSKSDACAEGKIGIGRWGLVDDDQITDLGEAVDVVVLSFRAKALDISGDVVINNHDASSDIYKGIRERSTTRDSGCMYGPEFLLYLPSAECFCTYFASSPTARRESKKIRPLIGHAATFKCHLIDNGRYKWHGPLIFQCSAILDLVDVKIIAEQIEKFKNPPVSDVETVDESDDNGREH